MIDEDFICDVCFKEVESLKYTARDHCPYCLCGKHVDNNPGDRQNNCNGILKPINIDKHKNSYKIVYKCVKCGEIKRNIMANDDDFDILLNIISNQDK